MGRGRCGSGCGLHVCARGLLGGWRGCGGGLHVCTRGLLGGRRGCDRRAREGGYGRSVLGGGGGDDGGGGGGDGDRGGALSAALRVGALADDLPGDGDGGGCGNAGS